MPKFTPVSLKKRKLEEGMRGKTSRPKKKFRKQTEYHSSSEDEDGSNSGSTPANPEEYIDEATGANATALATKPVTKPVPQPSTKAETKPAKDVRKQPAKKAASPSPPAESEDSDGGSDDTGAEDDEYDELDSDLEDSSSKHKTSKRNDPEAFSTSMSKILSTKLSQSVRKDPVLSRSREAAEASSKVANEKLEHRAKAKLRADKKEDLQRGRIKDVLGLSAGQTGQVAEEEKRLRKVAQRGVVKLFNAVRAAQVRGEQAAREERKKGTIGVTNREEKVNEISKQGFLDLINAKKDTATMES